MECLNTAELKNPSSLNTEGKMFCYDMSKIRTKNSPYRQHTASQNWTQDLEKQRHSRSCQKNKLHCVFSFSHDLQVQTLHSSWTFHLGWLRPFTSCGPPVPLHSCHPLMTKLFVKNPEQRLRTALGSRGPQSLFLD
jgi:hypothetical protein